MLSSSWNAYIQTHCIDVNQNDLIFVIERKILMEVITIGVCVKQGSSFAQITMVISLQIFAHAQWGYREKIDKHEKQIASFQIVLKTQ